MEGDKFKLRNETTEKDVNKEKVNTQHNYSISYHFVIML